MNFHTKNSTTSKIQLLALILLTLLCGMAARPAAAWSEEEIEAFSKIPIQSQGRVKPMSTFARFELLKVSGRAKLRIENPANPGETLTLSATEWLMDCLYEPNLAMQYKVMQIENPAIMQALGLPDDKKRTRFSFNQIDAVSQRMFTLAQDAFDTPEKQRSTFERQMLDLYSNYQGMIYLTQGYIFADRSVPIQEEQGLISALFDGIIEPDAKAVTYSQLIRAMSRLQLLKTSLARGESPAQIDPATLTQLVDSMQQNFRMALDRMGSFTTAMTIIPPHDPKAEKWLSPGELFQMAAKGEPIPEEDIRMLEVVEHSYHSHTNPAVFKSQLGSLAQLITRQANTRGEAQKIDIERFFYKSNFFGNALVFYILSFIAVGIMWLIPRNKSVYVTAWVLTVIPTLLVVAGIAVRCIIRGRPPVSTLYETTLFVPCCAILVALVMEWINRKRVALSIASGLGAVGMFLAYNYEMRDGGDTMPQLVAVLNSNFWLSTHVVTVTIGYSAGLLAAAIAHVYVIGRLFRLSNNREFFRSIARMVYGVACFGLLFSFVGTVLGGIWANYSWGRFWGWDPKENGALMIVIWFLIMLHGRMGGYLRDMGICLAAIFGAIVVAFSWWGVNLLGVGLHSYGFTEGVRTALQTFYLVEIVVIVLGVAANLVPLEGEEVKMPKDAVGSHS